MRKQKTNSGLKRVQENLNKATEIAEKKGLSKLSLEEINKEISKARIIKR